MHLKKRLYLPPIVLLLLCGCEPPGEHQSDTNQTDRNTGPPATIELTGWLASQAINEASGMQASHARAGDFFLHNDEGKPFIYAIDQTGIDLGKILIVPAKNKDWEDITSVPVGDGRWLVAGDIGDNQAKRKFIKLYFTDEPKTGKNDRYSGEQDLKHWLELTYPDGPHDCESMAYDPIGKQILLLTKRDKPPRLYAVDLETALTQDNVELTFLGTIANLRPPTLADHALFGGRTDFISQPTGFDISPDGSEAAIITYRSLYRFRREPEEDWLSALQKKPAEVVGPPAPQNEAIAYSIDGKAVYVTTEKQPAPVYRVEFIEE